MKQKQSIFRRDFLCCSCGSLRRADARFLHSTRVPEAPVCCKEPMMLPGYEQTVEATRLTPAKRRERMAAGAGVVKARGRRQWKAGK